MQLSGQLEKCRFQTIFNGAWVHTVNFSTAMMQPVQNVYFKIKYEIMISHITEVIQIIKKTNK